MTISERVIEALKNSIQDPLDSLSGAEMKMVIPGYEAPEPDTRPAVDRIIEGLAKEAAKGNASSAKELREWLRIEDELEIKEP
jgi:hypothetical protein